MSAHVPVLTAEVLQYLRPERGGLFVDCTVGLGGHARALLEAGASRIIGFDRDRRRAGARARDAGSVAATASSCSLGLPRMSIASSTPAASTRSTAPSPISASRRCSSTSRDAASASSATSRSTCAWTARPGDTAADLVARASERELADAIFQYGEERFSRRIARLHCASAGRGADRHDGPAGGPRPPRRAGARIPAHRPGDAHVPGAPHLGEPRARGPGPVLRVAARAGCARARGSS